MFITIPFFVCGVGGCFWVWFQGGSDSDRTSWWVVVTLPGSNLWLGI